MRSTACFLLFLNLCFHGVTPVAAANVTAPGLHIAAFRADNRVDAYVPTSPVKCDLVIEGDIKKGDSKELAKRFNEIVGGANSFTFFLCLRSAGGEVPEALEIARFVLKTQRPSIATVVEENQICASACALIFLAGNAPARVGAWPQRFLHPRARLSFHSSRMELAELSNDALLAHLTASTDARSTKDKVAGLYATGLRDVQSMISTFQKLEYQREEISGPWVKPSLFLEMFSQGPNEWVCVDSVDAMGRWNIQSFGYKVPPRVTPRHLMSWSRLSEQNLRIDKWSLCRG